MPTARAENIRFYEMDPVKDGGAETWYARAQNFLVAYSRFGQGNELEIRASENEYVVVLADGAISLESSAGSGSIKGSGVAIVPPGSSAIKCLSGGILARVFAPPPEDLLAKAANPSSYDTPHPNVAPLALWPMPKSGYKLQILEYAGLPEDAKRMIRSRNIMVNWAGRLGGPRDITRLSPHKHDDFEQMSLCIAGEYTHHVRYPWESDSTQWMEDDHIRIGTPSITIMPPPALHTSVGMAEQNALIDIFAPPRLDFSLAGLVNADIADNYPMPEGVSLTLKSGDNCQIAGTWRSQCTCQLEIQIAKGDLVPLCPVHQTVDYVIVSA